ncbi:MAG: IS66 family insertion sequence element accessory protein TnpB [Candidatus Thiodiazotropha sp.]|jgi:transposase
MLRADLQTQVYLYADPVDMRKSIDGLLHLVVQELALSPMTDALFVFCNRSRDKIKMLYWERNGFIVWYKRLEKQRFSLAQGRRDARAIGPGVKLVARWF